MRGCDEEYGNETRRGGLTGRFKRPQTSCGKDDKTVFSVECLKFKCEWWEKGGTCYVCLRLSSSYSTQNLCSCTNHAFLLDRTMEKVTCKYQNIRPSSDKFWSVKSTFGFSAFKTSSGRKCDWVDEWMDGHRCSWLSEAGVVYWSEGLSGLGSGRLLARYFARMLEVYCGEREDMKHV